ncbi:MAG: Hint domain-containing protein [Pseudomonadota bacterium]
MSQLSVTDLLSLDTPPRVKLPTQALSAGTAVLTLDGALPVQFLAIGDRVITRAGARTLRNVAVTFAHDVRLVRVSARALTPDSPQDDVILPPDQPVFVRDWRAPALMGQRQGTVPVRKLMDGEHIRAETFAEMRLFTLRFDREEVIYAGGMELVCSPEFAFA